MSSSSQPIQTFIDTLNDLFLYQHVTEPTRYRAGSTPHILDLVISNEEGMVQDISYDPGLGLVIMSLSHLLCLVSMILFLLIILSLT